VLDGIGVVRAGSLEHLLKVIRCALGRHLLTLVLCDGHERIPMPLLAPLLVLRAVLGALAGVLVLLGLASGAVENHSNNLLARSVASGNVEELLGGPWALAS
jgi:hypothetical protein